MPVRDHTSPGLKVSSKVMSSELENRGALLPPVRGDGESPPATMASSQSVEPVALVA